MTEHARALLVHSGMNYEVTCTAYCSQKYNQTIEHNWTGLTVRGTCHPNNPVFDAKLC